ncbi:MAG: hypothetical protein PHW65_06125 [Dehalococcoidales bacterium]|nr:hypothetical protein [Dehalococcoidales bacterium]
MFERKVIIDVTPTPDELAYEFAEMGAEQQAMFFSELARLVEKWDRPFSFQLQAVTDDPALTDGGRFIMGKIGEYGPKNR